MFEDMPEGSLLFDEPPIAVSPRLAERIGLSEAVTLQQLHYALRRFREADESWRQRLISRGEYLVRDGHVWIKATLAQWQREHQLRWMDIHTVQRKFEALRAYGLVRSTDRFNESRLDKTPWYTIDYAVYRQVPSWTPKRETQGRRGGTRPGAGRRAAAPAEHSILESSTRQNGIIDDSKMESSARQDGMLDDSILESSTRQNGIIDTPDWNHGADAPPDGAAENSKMEYRANGAPRIPFWNHVNKEENDLKRDSTKIARETRARAEFPDTDDPAGPDADPRSGTPAQRRAAYRQHPLWEPAKRATFRDDQAIELIDNQPDYPPEQIARWVAWTKTPEAKKAYHNPNGFMVKQILGGVPAPVTDDGRVTGSGARPRKARPEEMARWLHEFDNLQPVRPPGTEED